MARKKMAHIIYIVMQFEDHEGGHVCGVYRKDQYNEAVEHAKSLIGNIDYGTVETWDCVNNQKINDEQFNE
jgi:hypothetical protein